MPRVSKPIATDRRRRRWRIPDLNIQSACYPDTVRENLQFRSDFPADYVDVLSLHDAQTEQRPESPVLPDAQDDHCPGPECDSEKPPSVDPELFPQHIHRDPDGSKPPRESRSTNVLRRKNKLSSDQTPKPNYPSFAHVIQPPLAAAAVGNHGCFDDEPHEFSASHSNLYTAGHEFSGSHSNLHTGGHEFSGNHGNIRTGGHQTMHPKLAAELRELRELREITQEDKRRIEHLNSELAHNEVQIRALKHTISKVRTSNAAMTTDSQIETDYKYLIAQLKNWTLSHFRGCKPTHTGQTIKDFGFTEASFAAGAAKLLAENTPRRFQAVTMLVMKYLDKHVFSTFLFGADDKEQQLLRSMFESFAKTATPREINFWRSNTLMMIVATDVHKRRVHERKKEFVVELESLLVNTVPANGNSGKRVDSLKIVVDQAVALALTLRAQRANYFLYCESPGKKFQESIMELEGDADDDSDDSGESSNKLIEFLKGKRVQRKIGLTMFPALLKGGNDEGENYENFECLFKARVLRS